jgi:hypothetical protein
MKNYFIKDVIMKHAIEEKTRANVRAVITTIRTRHNCSRAEAEELFQRAIVDSAVVDALLEEVDRDVEEQKEYEMDMKPQ